MKKMSNINMLLDAVESEIVEKENNTATGEKGKKEESEKRVKEIIAQRKEAQPFDFPSSGSNSHMLPAVRILVSKKVMPSDVRTFENCS